MILPGLHATLVSLLQHATGEPNDLEVYVFFDGVSPRDQQRVRATFDRHARGARLVTRDYTPARLEGGNTLHGNTTVYGKMYIADLLPEHDRCLYIDADVIVTLDVRHYIEQIDDRAILYVSEGKPRATALHGDLYVEHGLAPDSREFNAGVMGFNLRRWRDEGCLAACRATAQRYAGRFRSADQGIFNLTLSDRTWVFGNEFNHLLYPGTPSVPADATGAIFHLVGAPKPWHPLASLVVESHPLWHRYARQSDLPWWTGLARTSPGKLARLSRSYYLVTRGRYRRWRRNHATPAPTTGERLASAAQDAAG